MRFNQETAKRLQDEHPEQFVTLVRMHLSFVLDLNTDTENDPVEVDKHKNKKWKGFHKKAKGCTSVKATSPETAKTTLTAAIIDNLRQLIAFLEQEHNISQEGIFRKTGSLTRQNELKNLLVQGNALHLDQGDYTAHDCASVLKNFLSELSEPLLTELYYPAYRQVAESFTTKESEPGRGEDWLLNALQLLLLLLPEENHSLFRCIIDLLYQTVQHQTTNKMSAVNLATLFTPHLICPRKLSANALHETASQMFAIIEFMIKTGARLFHIPTKLATDIRMYFVEQKRRKTMSPEHILNESTTSDSVANTVYTFVDREKTAEAHIMNSTDTALAQLYAHIQSLPESSKKKKLVSKFNRQNGYGTPLQVLMLREKNGTAGSGGAGSGGSVGPKYPRSFGDSIKRHIFHKSLMSRTPKRSGASGGTQTPTLFQTPNGSSYHGAKQRILFQSPASSSSSNSSPVPLKRSSVLPASSLLSGSGTPGSKQKSLKVGSETRSPVIDVSQRDIEQQTKDHKRRSTEVTGSATTTTPSSAMHTAASGDESHTERKRSRLEGDRSEEEERPRSVAVVRFAPDDEASQYSPSVDDEDFVEREDDDLSADSLNGNNHDYRNTDGDTESTDDEEFSPGLLPDRVLSDTEDERYGPSPIPGCSSTLGESRSRYRSEPNLSAIVHRKHCYRALPTTTNLLVEEGDADDGPSTAGGSKTGTPSVTVGSATKQRKNITFFKNKLIKGVSMGNLRFPFGSDSKSNKKNNTHRRSSESVDRCDTKDGRPPRSSSTVANIYDRSAVSFFATSTGIGSCDGSRETFHGAELRRPGWSGMLRKSDQNDALEAATDRGGCPTSYLTSTPGPATLDGRNSMSPITKSTQRMPKSMQESIMTPRSRKPVILLATLNGVDQQQQQQLLSTTCASFSSLREEDEESDPEPMMEPAGLLLSTGRVASHVDQSIKKLINDTGLPPIADEIGLPPIPSSAAHFLSGGDAPEPVSSSDTLTTNFRDYLLSRSVMPESPTDLSFATQSDDFESSAEMLERLSESKMSESLLHCLDGNAPVEPANGRPDDVAAVTRGPTAATEPKTTELELDETAL
ncbi:uncharacterized protein LOC131207191 [Anopheles bellator]|uniref:uncharacterized protein LOC131207191 n=1 Tax=Anopheles bellator TaxID=139047 RepID=UPI002648D55E|nr:uncharacterized protein LOC131207191 [Anopheles bellator]